MKDKAKEEGWGWPRASRKYHYFHNSTSLCGRWMFTGDLETGNDRSPDNCAECKRKFDAWKKQ